MLSRLLARPVICRFVQFSLIGLTCVLVDMVVLNALVNGFGVPTLKVNVYVAATLSFLCAATNGYYWNRVWTFRAAPRKRAARQWTQYVVVGVSGYLLGLLLMAVGIEGLALHYNVARLSAIAIVAAWNFALQSVWTFGH
jgi:putative flippase GtrA